MSFFVSKATLIRANVMEAEKFPLKYFWIDKIKYKLNIERYIAFPGKCLKSSSFEFQKSVIFKTLILNCTHNHWQLRFEHLEAA